jgi:DNA topoisomerase IB
MQDGEPTRVMGVIPPGGFYTGKDCYGCWARQLTEADLILNVSKGGTPPGWKGQVMNDPTKDFYVTWRHPVTGEKGYLYTSRAKADLQKFEEAQALGGALDEIRGKVVEDIKSSDPMTKMASLCTLLIDREHFRVGEEEHTATGTYGVASFLVGHVKINGSSVTFEFTGKKEEPWKRTLDFTRMPSALAFLKSCMAGKKPGDRLWSGKNWEATSKNVNEYLDQFSRGGVKFTAKMFRTFHANAYMHGLLNKLAKAQKDLKLSNADVKKLYKGFSVDDAAGKKLINLPYAGTTLGKFMGFTQHAGAKGRGDLKTGVLPTVASRLGHTTGACRNNYINPVTVTKFGADRGWDERTPKEKRTREDLPGFNPEEA